MPSGRHVPYVPFPVLTKTTKMFYRLCSNSDDYKILPQNCRFLLPAVANPYMPYTRNFSYCCNLKIFGVQTVLPTLQNLGGSTPETGLEKTFTSLLTSSAAIDVTPFIIPTAEKQMNLAAKHHPQKTSARFASTSTTKTATSAVTAKQVSSFLDADFSVQVIIVGIVAVGVIAVFVPIVLTAIGVVVIQRLNEERDDETMDINSPAQSHAGSKASKGHKASEKVSPETDLAVTISAQPNYSSTRTSHSHASGMVSPLPRPGKMRSHTSIKVSPPLQYSNALVPLSQPTFANSNCKRSYTIPRPATFQHELLSSVLLVLKLFAIRMNPTLNKKCLDGRVTEFMAKIQQDTFHDNKALQNDVDAVAELLWTSGNKHKLSNDLKLSSVPNTVIGDDIVEEVEAAAKISRSISPTLMIC